MSGQQIGTAVGFVAGFFLPGGPQVWASIGGMIGGVIAPEQIQGPKIGEVAAQTAQEGTPRPIIFARSQPIAGNVIADGGPVIKKKKESGKGGPEVTTESAFRTYAVGVCEGPGVVLLQVWKNGQLVYDLESSAMSDDNAEFLKYARWFDGSYTQMPSPDLEAALGVGNVQGHRGTAYIVFNKEDVTDQRGAWSQWTFRVGRYAEVQDGRWWAMALPEYPDPADRFLYRSEGGLTFNTPDFRGPPNEQMTDSTYGALIAKTPQDEMLVYGTTGTIERYSNYTAETLPTPAIETIYEDAVTLRRVRPFENCTVATVNAANRYHVRVDGVWTQYTVPDGLTLSAINRLENGVWVAFVHSGSDQRFLYCDEDLPTIWQQASLSTIPSNVNSDIGVVGDVAIFFGTAGRVFRSTGGLAWNPGPTGQVLSDGVCCKTAGSIIIFGDTNSPYLERSDDEGLNFLSIDSADTTQTIDYGNGQWVASGGDDIDIRYSNDDGLSWLRQSMPDIGDETKRWKVGYADPPFDYRNGYYPLPLIIQELSARVNADTHIDVSLLEDYQCRGMTVTSNYPCYSALQVLSQIFFFTPANVSGVIRFVPMGADSVATIVESELIDTDESVEEEVKKGDTISIPRVLHMNYYDVLGGLSTDKQRSERPEGTRAMGEQSMETPIILSADEAATIVAKSLATMVERQKGELTFSLPDNWLRLTESDPVFLQFHGQTVRAVIQKVDTDDGQQNYVALRDRQSIHSMVVEGFPPGVPTPPPSRVIGPTLIEVMDIPMWRDRDDALGFYVAISGIFPAWRGATVELSIDGGASYLYSISANISATMGRTVTVLADHPQEYPDSVHSVQVSISTPDTTLEATDLAGMLNRRNLAVIGDELIQFADVDEVSEGVWELSYLLRGRKQSDTEEHEVGERFVLLDGSVVFVPAELVFLNHDLTFRATSFGTSPEDATITTINFTGRSQQERRVGYLEARAESGDLLVSWQGAGRLGGGMNVSQGPNFVNYHIEVTDGITTRVFDQTEQSLTTPLAGLVGPITITVQQRNQFTGLGPATEAIYANP